MISRYLFPQTVALISALMVNVFMANPGLAQEAPPPIPPPIRHDPLLQILGDAYLPADETATGVVSIGGSSTAEGDVSGDVVSIAGNSTTSGSVNGDVVAVFGNARVNGPVRGEVVAIMGNVELGPNAVVRGEVTSIGGEITREPGAVVNRSVRNIQIGGNALPMANVGAWFRECLMLGRPLAFTWDVAWAWAVAGVALLLYLVISLLFPGAVTQCVSTFETRPGGTIVTSIVSLFALPLLIALLIATGVGIVVVPFLVLSLVLAGIFGRTVVLALIGRSTLRVFGKRVSPVAMTVLAGGVVVAMIYVIPFAGGLVSKLIGFLGFGAVAYTIILSLRSNVPAVAPGFSVPVPVAAGSAPTTPPQPAAASAFTQGETAMPREPMPSEPPPVPPVPPVQPAAPAPLPSPVPPVPTVYPFAGFWVRMMALLLDLIIISLLFGIVTRGVAVLPALAVYGACLWKLKGTTIGGIVFGLQVMRVDGREIDWPTAIVRALACFLSVAVVGLGFLWIAFDREKRSWHDKIAGTVVVRPPGGKSLV